MHNSHRIPISKYGMVWYSMVWHNGGMDHFTYELAPCPFFLAGSEHADCLLRTMHLCHVKVCHLQAKTLKDAGRTKSAHTIPQTSREILYTFGRRSYGLYGRTVFTVVRQYGFTVVRSLR